MNLLVMAIDWNVWGPVVLEWGTFVVPAVLTLLGVGLGALLTFRHNSRDLLLRSRVETIKLFGDVSSRMGPTRADGSAASLGERVAAMYLLADMADRDDWLNPAGAALLDEQIHHFQFHSGPSFKGLLADIKNGSRPNLSGTEGGAVMMAAKERDRLLESAQDARLRIRNRWVRRLLRLDFRVCLNSASSLKSRERQGWPGAKVVGEDGTVSDAPGN